VLVARDVKVLEHVGQVDSLDLDCFAVLREHGLDGLLLFGGHRQVFPPGRNRHVVGHWLDLSLGLFLNAVGRKGAIDTSAEVSVVEHAVSRLVFAGKSGELFLGKSKVEHREDCLELVFGHLHLPQLVVVDEKLLDSHSLHDHLSLEAGFDVGRVVCNFDSFLPESVVDNV